VPRFFVFVKDFSSKSALELLRDRAMDRIRVIEELLWPQVPADVIEEAKQTAQAEPTWIAMEGNCHVIATVPPGSLDGATGDVIYIAADREGAVCGVVGRRLPRAGNEICRSLFRFTAHAGQESRFARRDQGRADGAAGVQIQQLIARLAAALIC
jgi:hypothetical protein